MAELEVESYNKLREEPGIYDCDICGNKEMYAFLDDNGECKYALCKCKETRKTLKRIKNSGLEKLIENRTFDKYNATEKWQQAIRDKAKEFVEDNQQQWFFIGGQVGSGKTFICTSIIAEFIKQGRQAMYMVWCDDIIGLKATSNSNYDSYEKRMNELKKAQILYIDDFFRNEDNETPTQADIKLAYNLINYRYNNPELITIISSQFMLSDILRFSEAIGSRINEKTKNYQINLPPDIKKNYRLR